MSCRQRPAFPGHFGINHAHADQTPAPIINEPLQHFTEHVEVHLVMPIDQFTIAAQLDHVGIARAVI